MQQVYSELNPSSAESKAVARCQPFSRLLNLWCANNGLETSNEWRDNVLEEPPIFQLRLGQSQTAPSSWQFSTSVAQIFSITPPLF